MVGRRGRPADEDPLGELDPVAALARQLERVQRAQATQEELLRGLAGDVAALVEQIPTQHPPPTSWLLVGDPGEALEALQWLAGWVGDVYLWYPGARLPTCWLWHPAAVEELYCLAQSHREAYSPPTSSISKASEWHERFLPGVLRRLGGAPYKDCDLTRHMPGGDRSRTQPTTAPLHDAAHRITTEWINKHIPEPTQTELNEAAEEDQTQTRSQNQ